MSEKNIKKIGIRDALGEYIYTDIGVDADKVDIDSSTNLAEKLVEIDNKFEDLEAGGYANKNIYGDEKINLGRKVGTAVGPYSVTIGRDVSATGTCSLAEGKDTAAEGNYSHAEGNGTVAHGNSQHVQGKFNAEDTENKYAHIVGGGTSDTKRKNIHTLDWEGNAVFEGNVTGRDEKGNEISLADVHSKTANIEDTYALKSLYGDTTINVGRKAGTTVGSCSTAEGNGNTASGICSHAEGSVTTASGAYSHAEGCLTIASKEESHAEGYETTASGNYSHAEGCGTKAEGEYSHAEGRITTASGKCSHAEGDNSSASGNYSHAEGHYTQAQGDYSHAEGQTYAVGDYSHAEGGFTRAEGKYSHAEGNKTKALKNQHAQGHYNDTTLATANSIEGTGTGTAFVIGNGTKDSASNAFRVTSDGVAMGKSSFASSGADYAEYFEWQDGNAENEDRVGYFVTFADGRFIKKANEGDYILGIVSGMPCVIGNNDECWMKQFEMDEWGRFIYETCTEKDEETGEEKEYNFYKVNPDYDPTKPYTHREERPEWSAIGMVGVLSVRDDGTCEVDGYCKCSSDGIATACERGLDTFRVIERVTDNIVKVVIK